MDKCPSCGYCPHCGRSNAAPSIPFTTTPCVPYTPIWVYPSYFPQYATCNETNKVIY
jgi:hypothetical protein